MIEIKNKEDCCGCGACKQACPKQCIRLLADEAGFCYPQVDTARCVGCNLCSQVCPMLHAQKRKGRVLHVYAAQAKDEAIRSACSSGGVFGVLACYILDHGGVVFGAGLNEQLELRHIGVEEKSNLGSILGSKYIQSDTKDTFQQVRQMLEANRTVLYSGTPCQIAGLKTYLKRDYPNLYAVDLLCHGVPSPKVWHMYVEEQSKQLGTIRKVSFRDKQDGWRNFSMKMEADNAVRIKKHREDSYMRMFLGNIDLRDSCHHCPFKNVERCSDITLGDAWEIEEKMPAFRDDRGTSLVLVQSRSGMELMEQIMDRLKIQEGTLEELLRQDADSRISVSKHDKRTAFMEALKDERVSFTQLEKVMQKSMLEKFYYAAKKMVKSSMSKKDFFD